jgi:hypothetical protein
MRDQFAGDISDLLKLSLLRTLAGNDRSLGVGWYFIPDETDRPDGRHREFCGESKWKSLDKYVWEDLGRLPERSVKALEGLSTWPFGTKFHRTPIPGRAQRQRWFSGIKRDFAGFKIVFLDPDNGLGRTDRLHVTIDEVREMRCSGTAVVLIKFPAHLEHGEQIREYHQQILKDAAPTSLFTIKTSVMIETETKTGKSKKVPRGRWFSVIGGNGELKARGKSFVERLKKIEGCSAELIEANVPSGPTYHPQTLHELEKKHGNVCPECDYRFKGNGFVGIDAHWKANHEMVMPYSEAWPLIRAGKYRRGGSTL